jgi:hypothetical protein
MLDWITSLLSWIWSLWVSLPDETRQRVIRAFVDGLEGLIRKYYQEATCNP